MQEKRKYTRLPVKMELSVSNLFKQDGVHIDSLDTEIEVFDISKAGIGFMTTSRLPVGYYFNATIRFDITDEIILSVVKILNETPIGPEGYRYGCEFIGLPVHYRYIAKEPFLDQ